MDNLGAGCDPHESSDQNSAPNRARRKRSKYSSVNSRLDPNFDIKELVSRQVEENKSKNVTDPMTMEFEKLVGLLQPAFILEYMQKILQYLTGNMVKMSFQSLAPHKEAFLVRLCKEKSHLLCSKFDEATKKVAQQVIEVLEANDKVFDWICHYQKGILCSDVLVYEKVYMQDGDTKVSGVPPLRTLNSNNANGDSNAQKKPTPPSKIHLLNLLLKFMKDPTQLKLEYPVAPKSQASLLYSIIYQNKMEDTDIGFGCKSLYAPLYEALNVCKHIYDFNMTLSESSNDTMLMVLQKIPKGKISTTQNSDGDHNTSMMSMSSDGSENLNLTKKMISIMQLIPKVNETFVKTSLRKVLAFVKDEDRAGLEFTCPAVKEYRFLKAIPKLSRSSDYHHLFAPECLELLRKIERSCEVLACMLITKVTVVARLPKVIRCLTFHKILDYSKNRKEANVQLQNTNKVTVSAPQRDNASTSVISISSDSSENSNPSKHQFTMGWIRNLNEAFVRVTLTRILEFVKDEARASLEFTCLNVEEFRDNASTSVISISSDSSENSNPSKHQFTMGWIRNLNEAFVRVTLTRILEFVKDEARASLEFTCLNVEEFRYLKLVPQCTRASGYLQLFTPECQDLLRKIEFFSKNADWKITIGMENGSKGNRRRLIMHKSPDYSKKQSNKDVTIQAQNTRKDTSVAPQRRTSPPKAITFQAASAIEPTETIEQNATSTETRIDTAIVNVDTAALVANNSRKSRLLAAMSVPVESGIAERMMRQMGWTGGALGARGEGITEPLVPALHLAPKAGLGHVKKINATQSIYEFRVHLLNTLISFVRSGESETTIQYTNSLEKKKTRFVNYAIQAFKIRRGLALPNDNENRLVNIVIEELVKQGMKFEGFVSSDRRKISFNKVPSVQSTVDTPRARAGKPDANSNLRILTQSQSAPNVAGSDKSAEFVSDNEVSLLCKHFELDELASRNVKQLAYKVMCLTKIHKFVESAQESREYRFECILNSKLQAFVSNVLMNVNRKAKANYGTDIENVIYNEIKRATPAGCSLVVVFGTQKFTLHKKVYQKRFTNSARDLPPPKSTDLKNTIIYQNNKVISCNASDEDDDVIIIEKKVDIIEISDDEDKELTAESAKVDTAETSIDNLDNNLDKTIDLSIASLDESIDKIIDITKERFDDSLIALSCSRNVSISRETLSDMLENDYQRLETVDTELDNDIRVLEQAILDCDISDEEVMKSIKDEAQILVKTENNCKDLDLEINNNHCSLINENISNTNDCVQHSEEGSDKHNIIVDSGINKENSKDKSLDLNMEDPDHLKLINKDVFNNGECENILLLGEDNEVDEPPENVLYSESENKTTQQIEKESVGDTEYCNIIEQNSKELSVKLLQLIKDCDIYKEVVNKVECQHSLQLRKEHEVEEPFETEINFETTDKSTVTIEKLLEDDHDEEESYIEEQKAQNNANENKTETDTKEDPKENIPDKLQSSEENFKGETAETDLTRDYRDKSPGKRSRSASVTSESESSCKKCKSQIRSVRITCKDSALLNKNKIIKVQSFISESIDRTMALVVFLPRLECHGVKNGGLIYSCHNDESFAWLTNLILASDLQLNITETYYFKETYKMDIKIHSFDTVEKILQRIMLYNPELDTSEWRVIDKIGTEDFVVITVKIDRDSYDFVHKNNYSLFAGVDKAEFNAAWS